MNMIYKLAFVGLIGLLSILMNNKIYAQPDFPCECGCDSILYNVNSASYNSLWTDLNAGCYHMDIILSPCDESRTITGIIFSFGDMTDDPCIDRTWTIFDSDDKILWTGNPAESAPQISPLVPIVEPCDRQYYSFKFCPMIGPSGENCLGESYNITVTYIVEPPSEPCPPQDLTLTFDEITGVRSEDLISNINKSLPLKFINNDIIVIGGIEDNEKIIKPINLNLYDLDGKEITSMTEVKKNTYNIRLDIKTLSNQAYLIEVLYSDGIIRKGKFIK